MNLIRTNLFRHKLPALGDDITVYYDGDDDVRIQIAAGIVTKINKSGDHGFTVYTTCFTKGLEVSELYFWSENLNK